MLVCHRFVTFCTVEVPMATDGLMAGQMMTTTSSAHQRTTGIVSDDMEVIPQ